MKNNCEIVKDLLPLYAENLTSETSNQFIKKHILSCDECMTYLKHLKMDIPTVEESFDSDDFDDQKLVKTIQKRMGSQTFITAILGVLIGLGLSATIFPWALVALVAFLIFIASIIYLMY